MHQHEIIRIAQVVPDFQVMFDKLIQLIQIDVGEKLAAQIADGQPPHIPSAKQCFVGRNMAPQRPVPLHDHILGAVMKNDGPGQPPERVMPNMLVDELKQNLFVDIEKEALNIQLQGIARPHAIVRHAPHKGLQALHRAVRPLALPAGIGVMNEPLLPVTLQGSHQDMVDNPVTEIGRKNLPKFGVFQQKTDRTRGMVGPTFQLLVQLHEVLL